MCVLLDFSEATIIWKFLQEHSRWKECASWIVPVSPGPIYNVQTSVTRGLRSDSFPGSDS